MFLKGIAQIDPQKWNFLENGFENVRFSKKITQKSKVCSKFDPKNSTQDVQELFFTLIF